MTLLLSCQYPDVDSAAFVKKLPPLQQAQILLAAKAYFGPKRTLIGAFRGGECVMNGFWVASAAHPDVPLYDYWETNADSGYVFLHGTTTAAGVEQMQFDFEAMDGTPEAAALAEAMQHAKRVSNPAASLLFIDNGAGQELLDDFRHLAAVPTTADEWHALLAEHNVSEGFVRKYAAHLPPAAWERFSTSGHSRFSEQFYRDFADRLDWHRLSGQYRELSPALLRTFADRLDWPTASVMQALPEDLIRAHANRVDWAAIAGKQELSDAFVAEFADRLDVGKLDLAQRSEGFIRRHQSQLDWRKISAQATLSEAFIREFWAWVDWEEIASYQCLSTAFVEEFQGKINWYFLSMNPYLTEEQVRHFKDKIFWSNLLMFGPRISESLLREHETYVSDIIWRALVKRNRLSPTYKKEVQARLRTIK